MCPFESTGSEGSCNCNYMHKHTHSPPKFKMEQESPPSWMQEAYCLPHSKYSLCCSVSGGLGGWPSSRPDGGGSTPPSTNGGTPIQSDRGFYSPWWEYPIQSLPEGYPNPVMMGVNHPEPGQGTPCWDWIGVLPRKDVGSRPLGYPRKDNGAVDGSSMEWRCGTPPPVL